jgi:hypothetical protein
MSSRELLRQILLSYNARAMRTNARHLNSLGLLVPMSLVLLSACNSSTPFADMSARAARDANRARDQAKQDSSHDAKSQDVSKNLPEEDPISPKGAKTRTDVGRPPDSSTRTSTFIHMGSHRPKKSTSRDKVIENIANIQNNQQVPALILDQPLSAAFYVKGEENHLVVKGGELDKRQFSKKLDENKTVKALNDPNWSLQYSVPAQSDVPYLRYGVAKFKKDGTDSKASKNAIVFDFNPDEEPKPENEITENSNEFLEEHSRWIAYLMTPGFASFKELKPKKLIYSESESGPGISIEGYDRWDLEDIEVYQDTIGPYRILVGMLPEVEGEAAIWFIALPEPASSPLKIADGR